MIAYGEFAEIQREKRRELKQKYDELRLPKKVLLNGYIFSLHDILNEKLVFICLRNMSMDCDVRIHITWEQLEKAPNRVVQTTKDILDISGVLFYNIKGEHSEACRLRNAFNSSLTNNANNHLWVEQIETKKSLDTELDDLFKDSAHFTVDRKNTITVDLKMPFFHKKFSMYLDNNFRSEVFFFGSEDMITILRNVEDIFVDFTLINFKGNTDLHILTLLAADDNRSCLPCLHIVLNTRNKTLFRIVFSELKEILGHEDLKWRRCYSFHDKMMMQEFKAIFKIDLRYNHFEFIKELETETRKLHMANDEIQKIIISMCESLWMMDHGQRQASIDKLVQELKENQEGYPYSKLFQFFMNKLRIHGLKENENSMKCHYVWSNQTCETFHNFLKEKFRRKKMSINNVAHELRKLEFETRSNFLKGIYKYKNIVMPENSTKIRKRKNRSVTEIAVCEV
jgi:hypothetical protein